MASVVRLNIVEVKTLASGDATRYNERMQKWEYDVRPLSSDDLQSGFEDGLNSYGQRGWELLQVLTSPKAVGYPVGEPLLIFKRPLQEKPRELTAEEKKLAAGPVKYGNPPEDED